MKAIEEVLEQVAQSVVGKPETVRYETMVHGQTHWQGDVAITFVKALPKFYQQSAQVAQLAPGNTQGSRHVIADLSGIEIRTRKDADQLTGPAIIADRAWELTHPEHGHAVFPAGSFVTTYQRQYAEEMRRVQD